jgi:hypothetical protein
MENMKPEIMICECSSTDHQLVLLPFEDEHSKEVFIHVHLPTQPFWKRFVRGIKYIFGYKSRYGDFDEILLTDKHVPQLEALVNYLKEPIKSKE